MASRQSESTTLALLALAACIAACRGNSPPTTADTSRRSLPAGELVGFEGSYGSHVWKGIPYAAPPVGALRWRAAKPAPRWEGVREALATGAACPQFASVYAGEGRGATGVIGDEDCLTLDVYAPRLEPGEVPTGDRRFPVMVWIHGGGNSIGHADFYDGGKLAATHDLVVVAIQYRLGPLGWFRHASLRGEDTSEAERSGNFGTLDTIRALEWVRDNVAAFGGDPGNVTIFGESAGGRNVFSLLLSPLAEGLFHRAILQSPGLGGSNPDEAENFADAPTPGGPTSWPNSSNEVLAKLLVSDGSVADRESALAHIASMDGAEVAAYLRAKSARELLHVHVDDPDTFQGGMIGFSGTIRDGSVLPSEAEMESLARGAYHQVPVIFGTNRDENKLFMIFDPSLVRWRLGIIPRLVVTQERYDALSDHHAHAWKARSVDVPAALMRAVQGPSVYAYRWDWDEEPRLPFLFDGGKLTGAAHGLEIPFVFGHWDLGPDTFLLFGSGSLEGRVVLSAQMMSYWAEFAYTGSPGRGRGGDLLEWPAWDDSSPEAPKYIVFDTPQGGGLELASKTFDMNRVVSELLADARLATARDRCGMLRELTAWQYLSQERYASTPACRDYAYQAFPWPDVALGD